MRIYIKEASSKFVTAEATVTTCFMQNIIIRVCVNCISFLTYTLSRA